MRQKDASETEVEGIQNNEQASNAIWSRHVGYNGETRKRIKVTAMRMLRWMCGVTRKDKIRIEHIRGTTRVAQASKKITERRLNWYGLRGWGLIVSTKGAKGLQERGQERGLAETDSINR